MRKRKKRQKKRRIENIITTWTRGKACGEAIAPLVSHCSL
jgi:hypothetical protein